MNKKQLHHYQIIAHAIEYIRANAQYQPSLKEIATETGLSEYHLQRIFTEWAGVSPKRFLQFITKERALESLKQSKDVLSVALDSGLSGSGRLHDLLVSCEAMTPGEIKALGAGLTIGFGNATTPFGNALFGWTERGICHLSFYDHDGENSENELATQWPEANLIRNDQQASALSEQVFIAAPESVAKKRKLNLIIRGTNFQIKVWQALLNTTPSQVLSYSQLAKMAGSEKAHRAVGSAVAANQIAYLIPCHRVIRGNGDSGEYRWGHNRKIALQAWEASQ